MDGLPARTGFRVNAGLSSCCARLHARRPAMAALGRSSAARWRGARVPSARWGVWRPQVRSRARRAPGVTFSEGSDTLLLGLLYPGVLLPGGEPGERVCGRAWGGKGVRLSSSRRRRAAGPRRLFSRLSRLRLLHYIYLCFGSFNTAARSLQYREVPNKWFDCLAPGSRFLRTGRSRLRYLELVFGTVCT